MSNNRAILALVALFVVAHISSATLQADPPKNKGNPSKKSVQANPDGYEFSVDSKLSVLVTAGISSGDARMLASKYEFANVKPLPPGTRKNLARGKPMPPGIQKTRMPDSFIRQLPYHEGYEWRRAGTDLVLVFSASLVVSDVLKGVFE